MEKRRVKQATLYEKAIKCGAWEPSHLSVAAACDCCKSDFPFETPLGWLALNEATYHTAASIYLVRRIHTVNDLHSVP